MWRIFIYGYGRIYFSFSRPQARTTSPVAWLSAGTKNCQEGNFLAYDSIEIENLLRIKNIFWEKGAFGHVREMTKNEQKDFKRVFLS